MRLRLVLLGSLGEGRESLCKGAKILDVLAINVLERVRALYPVHRDLQKFLLGDVRIHLHRGKELFRTHRRRGEEGHHVGRTRQEPLLLMMLIEQMQNNAVDERNGRVFPEGIFAAALAGLDHHLRDGGNVGQFLEGLEVDLRERVPLRRRAVLTQRLKLHDFLPHVVLAPCSSECPELALGVKEEDAVLPAEPRRHHVADALAAARRCNEQNVLGSVMEHDFVVEGVLPDDKSGLLGGEPCLFDVLRLGKVCRSVRAHAGHAAVDLIADKDPYAVEDPRHIEVAADRPLYCVIECRIGSPQVNRKGLEYMSKEPPRQQLMVLQCIGDQLCRRPVPSDIGDGENDDADQDKFVAVFLIHLHHYE